MENLIRSLYIFVALLLTGISVGYALLSTELNINAKVSIKKDCNNINNLYDRMQCLSVPDNVESEFVTSATGVDFSDTNGKGVYQAVKFEGENTPIYYYRGDVKNNNVIFANKCWKIVRTTETKGIKLIYNGEVKIIDDIKSCDNTEDDSTIGSSAFNLNYNSLAYNGYMYGDVYERKMGSNKNVIIYGNDVNYNYDTEEYTLIDTMSGDIVNDADTIGSRYHYTCLNSSNTCKKVNYIYGISSPTIYYIVLSNGEKIGDAVEKMTTKSVHTTDSTIKTKIDTWYKDNMLEFDSKIEDTPYCNDRTIENYGGFDKDSPVGNLYFKKYNDIMTLYKPVLKCSNKHDAYTVNDTVNGNGNLTYKIGLLTADEILYAGAGRSSSSSNYLYIGYRYWWNGSPYFNHLSYIYSFSVGDAGNLGGNFINNEGGGIRPAISLMLGTKFVDGDGTVNNPFIVE